MHGEIKNLLSEYHEKEMSISTLERRIKSYGLSRRNADYDEHTVRDAIRDMIDGPACLWGYRSVCYGLQSQGMRVPRTLVQQLLKDIVHEYSLDCILFGLSKDYNSDRLNDPEDYMRFHRFTLNTNIKMATSTCKKPQFPLAYLLGTYIDPHGSSLRKAHRLKRRTYRDTVPRVRYPVKRGTV